MMMCAEEVIPWQLGGQRWLRRHARRRGWTARKKADAVVRLLRGESLDELSRELRVEAHRLQAWRDEFLAGGIEGLKARPLQPEDRRLKEAERKVGELTMDNEILRAAARKRGVGCIYSVQAVDQRFLLVAEER